MISLSTDEASQKDAVLKFLKDKSATFPNLLIDEDSAFYQEKLRFDARPSYYVFNRQGKWTQFKTEGANDVNYEAMEKLIAELLREKSAP